MGAQFKVNSYPVYTRGDIRKYRDHGDVIRQGVVYTDEGMVWVCSVERPEENELSSTIYTTQVGDRIYWAHEFRFRFRTKRGLTIMAGKFASRVAEKVREEATDE